MEKSSLRRPKKNSIMTRKRFTDGGRLMSKRVLSDGLPLSIMVSFSHRSMSHYPNPSIFTMMARRLFFPRPPKRWQDSLVQ